MQEINDHFQDVYGWSEAALIGQSLGMNLHTIFRDSHHAGFARFQLTEVSKVLNHPLKLATFCLGGHAIESEHFIIAKKHSDASWSLAAMLPPFMELS